MKGWKFGVLIFSILFNHAAHSDVPQLNLPTKGWHNIPDLFVPYLNINNQGLTYRADSKFLREFRVDYSSAKGPRHIYLNWQKVKIDPSAPEEVKKCWGVFISGGSCGSEAPSPLPSHYSQTGQLDLLEYSRYVSAKNGLAVARDILVDKILEKDASHGEARRRIIEATQDKNKVFSDSLATIPEEERKNIGIYLVLGIGGQKSANASLIQRASAELKSMGFQSEMLMVDGELGSDHNALMLKEMLGQRLPSLEKVVFVAASKGVADFITYFLNHGDSLSAQDRDKVRLMVSLAGVIRPSVVAQYITQSNGVIPTTIGAALTLTGRGNIKKGIRSLVQNPWTNHEPRKIKEMFPKLTWISMPAVPEGPEGVTHRGLWEGFLKTPTYRYNKEASPMDGLVESAASVLPPDTGLVEWIIPIFGPHAIALGYYTPTLKVAPISQSNLDDKVVPEAGAEMLSAIFRALPRSLIDDSP